MITVSNLSKRFAGRLVVAELSIQVAPGEIVCFLGVNGAGKTTTLRMLSGILLPDSGQITIFGNDLVSQPEKAKRLIGYIPDRPHLYPKLTAKEHLLFCGSLLELPRGDLYRRADELLDEFNLSQHADELSEGFSHGMKQRLAICAALLHRPKFLVVDEPLVGLDPHGARHLKEYLKQLSKNGCAVLLSTHLLDIAEELATRVAIIHRGSLLKVDTLSKVRGDSSLEHVFLALTSEEED